MSWELGEVLDALEAARMLAEAVATDQLGPEHDRRTAPRALTSLLRVVGLRLRDVERVVRGDLDASHLRSAHNEVRESVRGLKLGLVLRSTKKATQ